MSLPAQKARFVVADLRGPFQKWSEKNRIAKSCGKICRKNMTLKFVWDQICLGCTQREVTVNQQAVRSKTERFRRFMTTEGSDGKDPANESNPSRKIARPCWKMCWEVLRFCKERCTFFQVGGNSVSGRSPDSSRRFWGTKRTLWCMCPDCPEMLRVPHSFSDWMCKKQSAVSHSSAESEIVSLDAGFTRKWFARASVLGLRNAEWKCTPARRNARLKQDVSDSNSHSHAENCVSENIDHGHKNARSWYKLIFWNTCQKSGGQILFGQWTLWQGRHKVEQSVWQKIVVVNKLHRSKKRWQAILSCWKWIWRLQTWLVPTCLFCKWSAGLQLKIWGYSVDFRIPHARSDFSHVQESPTAVQKRKSYRLMQVYEYIFLPALQFLECVLETDSLIMSGQPEAGAKW